MNEKTLKKLIEFCKTASATDFYEIVALKGVIVTELKLNKAANGVEYCFFRIKAEFDKFDDYISVKAWGNKAVGIVRFLKYGDHVEGFGSLKSEYRDRKIVILDENGNEKNATMTEEKDRIVLKLNAAASKSLSLKQCDRHILCEWLDKIEN